MKILNGKPLSSMSKDVKQIDKRQSKMNQWNLMGLLAGRQAAVINNDKYAAVATFLLCVFL